MIEVLIATTILAVGVVSLAQLFVIAVASNVAASHQTHAAVLAAQKLEELRTADWGAELQGGTADRIGPYQRQWSVVPVSNLPEAAVVDVVVTWNRRQVGYLATIKARKTP